MKSQTVKFTRLLVALLTGALLTLGASAEKPEWAGGGKNGKQGQKEMQAQSDASGQSGKSGKPGKGAKANEDGLSTKVTVGAYY